MDHLYEQAAAKLEEGAPPYKPGERADKQQLIAQTHLDDPSLIVNAFAQSVEQFERDYVVPPVPFNDGHGDLSDWLERPLESNHAVVARIIHHGATATGPLPDFEYLDREVAPGRAPGGVMPDGRSARTAPRIDLLLMRTQPTPRVPIVCELKVRGDQNAHYALIQALALAAQLAPAEQRKRLSELAYPDHSVAAEGGMEVWIALVAHNDRGKQKQALSSIAKELAVKLIGFDAVNKHIAAIRCTDVTETPGAGLKFQQRWVAAANS